MRTALRVVLLSLRVLPAIRVLISVRERPFFVVNTFCGDVGDLGRSLRRGWWSRVDVQLGLDGLVLAAEHQQRLGQLKKQEQRIPRDHQHLRREGLIPCHSVAHIPQGAQGAHRAPSDSNSDSDNKHSERFETASWMTRTGTVLRLELGAKHGRDEPRSGDLAGGVGPKLPGTWSGMTRSDGSLRYAHSFALISPRRSLILLPICPPSCSLRSRHPLVERSPSQNVPSTVVSCFSFDTSGLLLNY